MSQDLWYALKTKPRMEFVVAANLQVKGYELFLPTYKSKRKWSDRTKILELPLFPGYLFCHFNVNSRLPILITPGVSSIVSIGKRPEPIDPSEIEAIQTVVRSGMAYQPHPYLAVGQVVQVQQGALAGLTGLITQVKNELRLVISVNLLMRSVSVEIDQSWVEPVRQTVRERSIPSAAGAPPHSLSRADEAWPLKKSV